MKCENNLCVYYRRGVCALSRIELDSMGICASCIQVSFSEKELLQKREEVLRELEGM